MIDMIGEAREILARNTLAIAGVPAETLDSIRPDQWRSMTPFQRTTFIRVWGNYGYASHCCLKCGFPTVYGQSGCEACK